MDSFERVFDPTIEYVLIAARHLRKKCQLGFTLDPLQGVVAGCAIQHGSETMDQEVPTMGSSEKNVSSWIQVDEGVEVGP